ncbi:CDP-alcohol phosphatidyltransferase [Tepidicaulis marinus]|uniref:CDP-diacylglycerol--glycerol-3-phosphate 3-phosphatidyltransferase n=1 Tax=Tepidicaulis marinus TaxID=1333998 RepID=A0A081B9E1_9HYPH|nr:CDP-alcohol phosphatidyltransferase family protein [Tepidicaulis marinus]GAK44659.1 CDP-alcohol phosphatidyltransferase [Tepidicaulis marinus]
MNQLPNIITIARLFLVPVIIYSILNGQLMLAFWLFVAAGLSDAVDGFLARQLSARSELGAYLDPVADKALLVSIYVSLGWAGFLPDWLVLLVVSRDVMIVGGVLLGWVMAMPLAMDPALISKANTAAQIALAALVLAVAGSGFEAAAAVDMLVIVTAATTGVSALGYLLRWGGHMGLWTLPGGGGEASAQASASVSEEQGKRENP